jgi:hypothetical protein
VSTEGLADALDHGPRLLGLLVVGALALGARNGADGGPLALEHPEVHHVLLAPIDRRRALLRPATQRIRSVVFATSLVAAVAGQLAGRRFPGSLPAWAAWGAAFGLLVGTLYIGAALLVHGLHLPRTLVTSFAALLLGWQLGAVATSGRVPGPGDAAGHLALAGAGIDTADLVGALATGTVGVIAISVGLALVGHTSVEAMARRSGLVAQLRFAVTMQDLRTVMLLRRQLSQERIRSRPWFAWAGPSRRHPAWRRAWRGLLRFPARRLVRLAALAALSGSLAVAAFRGTTPAIVGVALAWFVIGLEASEPLAEALDRPDLTAAFPVEPGTLHLALLRAPACLVGLLGVLAGAISWLWEPGTTSLAVIGIVCLPAALAGAAGAAVSVVQGAPDVVGAADRSMLVPPEMSGLGTMLRHAWPPAISVLGVAPLLLVRQATEQGANTIGAAVRAAATSLVVVVFVAWWVRRRDDLRRRWRAMLDASTTGATR